MMNVEEIIAKAKDAGLREFGVCREDLADKWARINEEAPDWEGEMVLAAGLNNNDLDRALLAILRDSADKVIDGMLLAAQVVNAKRLELHVPEGESELAKELEAKCADKGIEVVEGFIEAREMRGKTAHHIETMMALSEVVAGSYEPGTLMAVSRGGQVGALKKVAYGTKVADLVGDASDVKGIVLNSKLYSAAAGLDIVIGEDTGVGSGVVTVIDKSQCIIDEASKLLLAERKNGCGKCTFCREGLGQLHVMTREITQGQGKASYLDMMKEIGEAMSFSTLCSVGQTGADFTLGSLTYFADEYTDHIKKKKCATNVCKAFMSIYIDPTTCTGCEECVDVCPVGAIEGKSGFIHMIDEFECTKCGACVAACDEGAIIQTTGRVPKLPTRLVKVGKFKKR